MFNLTTPPILTGDAVNQLTQLRSFLYQMTEQLNMASIQLDEKVNTVSIASSSGSKAKSVAEEKAGEYNALKALITKTADYTEEQIAIVNNLITNTTNYTDSQMADIRTQVETNTDGIAGLSATVSSEYVAKSEYGTWQEDVINQLSINADSIDQNLKYLSQLQVDVEKANASFSNYVVATEGSIKVGIVEWSEDGTTPLFGVAVGQDVTYREVTVDGVTYAEINKDKFLATFTSKALKFWQGEQLVAYITNNELYITNTRIIGNLGIGEAFNIRADNVVGFVIEYIGE